MKYLAPITMFFCCLFYAYRIGMSRGRLGLINDMQRRSHR